METVVLSDGRKVEMRELTGKEVVTAGRLGKGDAVQMIDAALMFSIDTLDGQKVDRPTNIVSVQALLAQIKLKDVDRLRSAYIRMNGDDDTPPAVGEELLLGDGRKVTLRELNGMHEMSASRLAGGDLILTRTVLTIFSIATVDGAKFVLPTNMNVVHEFLRGISAKDLGRLNTAFKLLNGDEEAGEADAAG